MYWTYMYILKMVQLGYPSKHCSYLFCKTDHINVCKTVTCHCYTTQSFKVVGGASSNGNGLMFLPLSCMAPNQQTRMLFCHFGSGGWFCRVWFICKAMYVTVTCHSYMHLAIKFQSKNVYYEHHYEIIMPLVIHLSQKYY